MHTSLIEHIPENATKPLLELLQKNPVQIKIVKHRSSKHGDFRSLKNGDLQISINSDLNKYQFLLTLIHELAHLVTYLEKKHHRPHGIEWKRNFQHLMLPFLNPAIFPNDLLPYLAKYLKNPKASTGSDTQLTYALKQYDPNSGTHLIFELPLGSSFLYKKKKYIKGDLRRTRYECIQLGTHKKYLFNKNAEVILAEKS